MLVRQVLQEILAQRARQGPQVAVLQAPQGLLGRRDLQGQQGQGPQVLKVLQARQGLVAAQLVRQDQQVISALQGQME